MNINSARRMTRAEVAKHLRCSIASVIRYGRIGLKSHRIGPRLVRYWENDVLAFQEELNGKKAGI